MKNKGSLSPTSTMSPFPYDLLYHYSEKFTRDPDHRQDLVLMAWQQDKRFGDRSEIRLLKNYIKYRAKEISSRNSLRKSVGGKSKRDAYSQPRVSIFKKIAGDNQFTLADTLSLVAYDPFGQTVVNDFSYALLGKEADVAEQIIAGFTDKEASVKLRLPIGDYRRLKFVVQEKAMEYLV